MILLIDNYDSFTFNLAQYLGELGAPPLVRRNDELSADEVGEMRPDRIVVGEMREGSAALETLKAWNTGHPGGLSTIHANSAGEVRGRLEDLLLEVAAEAPRRLLDQAVDLIVHIRRTPQGRVIEAVLAREDATD